VAVLEEEAHKIVYLLEQKEEVEKEVEELKINFRQQVQES
jgi:hypothetical protein